MERLIWFAGISTILIVALIFFFLIREGLPTFLDIPLRELFGSRWYPIEGQFGLWPLIAGSLVVTVGAVLNAVPLGLVTAIYLGEIAPQWQRERHMLTCVVAMVYFVQAGRNQSVGGGCPEGDETPQDSTLHDERRQENPKTP